MPHPPNIPLTPQTDERMFPRWQQNPSDPKASGYIYPKMLTKVCTPADRKIWTEKNKRVDQNTRQEYWESSPPRVGNQIPLEATQELVDQNICNHIGEPVIAQTKEQETEILKILGLLTEPEAPVKPVRIPLAEPRQVAAPVKQRRRRRRRVTAQAPAADEHETTEEL